MAGRYSSDVRSGERCEILSDPTTQQCQPPGYSPRVRSASSRAYHSATRVKGRVILQALCSRTQRRRTCSYDPTRGMNSCFHRRDRPNNICNEHQSTCATATTAACETRHPGYILTRESTPKSRGDTGEASIGRCLAYLASIAITAYDRS